MGQRTVYIETSVVSYLTARPTGDLLAAACQKITLDWWETRRSRYDLYTSDVTIEEARRGNPDAGVRRLNALSGIPVLPITQAAVDLSKELFQGGALPTKAGNDALHVAVSAVHGIDYLLTWNCRHLDNVEIKPVVRKVCALHGYASPEICTPQEFMGGFEDV